jgi:copper chaperone CopZ
MEQAKHAKHAQGHLAGVVSRVPGRVRVRFHQQSRAANLMGGIADSLQSLEGIHGVKVNPATGSMTVHYDYARHGTDGILSVLQDLDVVFESTTHAPDAPVPEAGGAERGQAQDFLAAIDDLNARIRATSGVPVNLRIVLPLAFAAAGIWSVAKQGLMIESIPGWLFLWLAFDMFVKLHPSRLHK